MLFVTGFYLFCIYPKNKVGEGFTELVRISPGEEGVGGPREAPASRRGSRTRCVAFDPRAPWGPVTGSPSQERRRGRPGLRTRRGVVVSSQRREAQGRRVSTTCTWRAPERRTSSRGRALKVPVRSPAGARHEARAGGRAMPPPRPPRGAKRPPSCASLFPPYTMEVISLYFFSEKSWNTCGKM